MSSNGDNRKYAFGGILLDPRSRTVHRQHRSDPQPIEVQSLVFDLLLYLARKPGEVVSKEQLLEAVWHNQHLTDATITQAVKKARQAVGDDGQRQEIIRTIHGKGIRLVAEVQVIHPATAKPPGTSLRPVWLLSAIVLAALFLILAATLLNQSDQISQAAVGRIAVFPFTNDTGDEQYQWLEHGLAETTSLLLEQTTGSQIRHPKVSADTEAADLGERTRQIGADFGLSASIARHAGQFEVHWSLATPSAERESGQFQTADASSIARLLTEAAISTMTGAPPAPITSVPILQDPLAMELYARGMEAFYREEFTDANTLLKAALSKAPDSIAIQFALAEAQFDTNDAEKSLSRYRDLMDTLPEMALKQRAQLTMTLGTRLWYEGQIQQAETLLREARVNFAQGPAQDNWWLARTLNSLGFVLQSQSRFTEAWEVAREAELLMREQQDPYHLSHILTNLGYLAEDLGRIREAADYQEQALEIRSQYVAPSMIAASQYALARIERRSGRFDAAAALLDKSLAAVIELGLPYDQFDNLEELAEVRARQNRIAEAIALTRQAKAIAETAEDLFGIAWADQQLTRLALRQGLITSEAIRRAEVVVDRFDEMGEQQDAYIARLELVEMLVRLGDIESAEQQLSSDNPATENPSLELLSMRIRAMIANANGNREAALKFYADLVQKAREIGAIDIEAEAAIELGHLAIGQQDGDLANRMLTIAKLWSPDYYRTRALESELSKIAEPPGPTASPHQ